MTQLVLDIQDPKDASLIRKLLSKFDGVTVKTTRKKKTGLDLAWDDVAAGRVTEYSSVEEMFQSLGIKI